MSKKVVVLSTSLRSSSNSELLAKSFVEGARDTGNEVEYISLKNKDIRFCIGCLACQKTGHCVIKDDVADIMNSVLKADVVVWATPIYYYEMSGQMKTLIDRLNPMYSKDYKFRDVYLLATAAEEGDEVFEKAITGLSGWNSSLIASHKYPKFTGEHAVCSEEKYKLPRSSIKCGYDNS